MEPGSGKIQWMDFKVFEQHSHVAHGFFSRHGGVSEGPFASLNLSEAVGDHPDRVKVNRERLRQEIGVSHLVFPNQNHGVEVARIDRNNVEKAHRGDALFTTEPGIGLAVTHADCQGAVFFDPAHQAIAVAHVGWKGSVQNVYGTLIEALKRALGTKAEDLIVGISPSLGPDHAEFENYKRELPQEFWAFQPKPHYFDFWEISKHQLLSAGVREKNIEIAKICTYCAEKDFFSYRREKKTGRNATVIAMKK